MIAVLDDLRTGGKRALARALAQVESAPDADETIALLDAAFAEPHGLSVGVTGPPGVGKSTLVDSLIANLRAQGISVAVIAIDPSSMRSGGALLGDRARLATLDPGDQGVFVRSMASRGRLGGLSDLVFPAMVLMQALYDIVLIETVGVGQSEIEVSGIADSTLLCVQPASGDSLQFLKAGVMEVPDFVVVTKSDLGAAARRAATDLRSALAVTQANGTLTPILLCSAQTGEGINDLVSILTGYKINYLMKSDYSNARLNSATAWCNAAIIDQFGRWGLEKKIENHDNFQNPSPFAAHNDFVTKLKIALRNLDFCS